MNGDVPQIRAVLLRPQQRMRIRHPINFLCSGGYTALHMAAIFGHTGAMEELLNAGAEPAASSGWRYTPLHFAALGTDPECCISLLKHVKGDALNMADKEQHTPLALAVYYNRTQNVDLLLEAGCDVNARDRSGGTLLHYLADKGGSTSTLVAVLAKVPTQPTHGIW